MNDIQVDSVVRRLDVRSDPPAAFVDASFRTLTVAARLEVRRERSLVARVTRPFTRRVELPAPWTSPVRRIALAAAAAMLILALAWIAIFLIGRPSNDLSPWSATRILFGRENRTAGAYDLEIIGADGTGESLLRPAPNDVSRVSSDGRRIAVAVVEGDRIYAMLMDLDGSNAVALHPDPTLNLAPAAWSRDGTQLAFEGWDDTNPDRAGIYLMRADGTGLHRLTGPGVPGDFSPDGRQIVLARQEGVFVVDVDGTNEHQVGALKPANGTGYLQDGRALYVAAAGSLWIVDLATGESTQIAIPGGSITQPRLSPDGRTFVFVYDAVGASTTGIWTVAADGFGLRKVVDVPDLGEVFPDWLP